MTDDDTLHAPFIKAGHLARKILGPGCENDITRAVDNVIDAAMPLEQLTDDEKRMLKSSRKAFVKARNAYAKMMENILWETSATTFEKLEQAIADCNHMLAWPTRPPPP
jgi:hypothetical protein